MSNLDYYSANPEGIQEIERCLRTYYRNFDALLKEGRKNELVQTYVQILELNIYSGRGTYIEIAPQYSKTGRPVQHFMGEDALEKRLVN